MVLADTLIMSRLWTSIKAEQPHQKIAKTNRSQEIQSLGPTYLFQHLKSRHFTSDNEYQTPSLSQPRFGCSCVLTSRWSNVSQRKSRSFGAFNSTRQLLQWWHWTNRIHQLATHSERIWHSHRKSIRKLVTLFFLFKWKMDVLNASNNWIGWKQRQQPKHLQATHLCHFSRRSRVHRRQCVHIWYFHSNHHRPVELLQVPQSQDVSERHRRNHGRHRLLWVAADQDSHHHPIQLHHPVQLGRKRVQYAIQEQHLPTGTVRSELPIQCYIPTVQLRPAEFRQRSRWRIQQLHCLIRHPLLPVH